MKNENLIRTYDLGTDSLGNDWYLKPEGERVDMPGVYYFGVHTTFEGANFTASLDWARSCGEVYGYDPGEINIPPGIYCEIKRIAKTLEEAGVW